MIEKIHESDKRTPTYENLIKISETIDTLELKESMDTVFFEQIIKEFSSFICTYDSSFLYNQSFLPTIFKKFRAYLNTIQDINYEIDAIVDTINNYKKIIDIYRPNNDIPNDKKLNVENKKLFTISINDYIQSNLNGEKEILKNKSSANLLKNCKNYLITFKFKNEICTFKCFNKKDDSLILNEEEIILKYIYLYNLNEAIELSTKQ